MVLKGNLETELGVLLFCHWRIFYWQCFGLVKRTQSTTVLVCWTFLVVNNHLITFIIGLVTSFMEISSGMFIESKSQTERRTLHAKKVCVFGVILVRIFPAFSCIWTDWIRRDTKCLSVFSPNAGKCGKNADQGNPK